MRNRAAIALGLSLLLAGCREPTAPEARSIARSVQAKITKGDFSDLSDVFMFMGTIGSAYWMPMAQNEALQIMRDGIPLAVNGFVVEEVLVAPGNIGKPLVRRSLVGWPTSEEFAVMAFTDIHPGTLRPLSEDWGQQPHQSFTTLRLQIPGDSLASWVPYSGTVDIGDATIDRECGTKDPVPQLPHAAERVQCHFALFEVAVHGELITLADQMNPLLRSFQRRHRLYIPRQRLPGIRFVTTCAERPDMPDLEEFDCQQPIRFWRDNSQYAPSLGIDVATTRRISGNGAWLTRMEKWSDGTEHDQSRVRWIVHAPDGRLVESGSRTADETMSPDRVADWLSALNVLPDVRLVQAIVPAQLIDRNGSPYEVRILDLEVLDPE
jgi:hypothetical protein